MKAFVGGVVFTVVVIGAVTWFGWLPVVLVLGGAGVGAAVLLVLMMLELGRWFGW